MPVIHLPELVAYSFGYMATDTHFENEEQWSSLKLSIF